MSLPPVLERPIATVRTRRALIAAALLLPLLVLAAVAASRLGAPVSMIVPGALLIAAAVLGWQWARKVDPPWMARRLDRRPDMQDSADLLFRDIATLNPLQQLQRERLLQHLAAAPPALRPAWPATALATVWVVSMALCAILLLPLFGTAAPTSVTASATNAPVPAAAATHTTLLSASLETTPPAYTGLPASAGEALSGKVNEGSLLRWTLRLEPMPAAVDLVFHDGETLALQRNGDAWTSSRPLRKSTLYRIAPRDALPLLDDRLHRIDVIPDRPPQVRVLEPERSLTLLTPGQRRWTLRFEASDDHGLGSARLGITLAQGSGEQVTVSERSVALTGAGDARLKSYAHTLDLAALGLAEGDDVIVRLVVSDKRTPEPQSTRSASFILRWPLPPSSESTGMEGLVKNALPAYFRSQRQIIIDAEALVAERPRLASDTFMGRSDGVGVDQRILRMRYGQFLGEENEGEPEAPPDPDGEVHTDDDGHDHGGEPPGALGRQVNVLEEYGHTHDDAEAATLLDPETRALLKQALDAMWLSEGELRQGQPERALAHAYRALGFIKQVQQATRIYLARVGLELPPIDDARRMTGDRAGLGDRRSGLVVASTDETPALPLWRALGDAAGGDDQIQAMADWVARHEDKISDPLSLVAAIDAVRADPDCLDCRQQLRGLLWPLLPRPAAAAQARPAADERGQAYLDALSREAMP